MRDLLSKPKIIGYVENSATNPAVGSGHDTEKSKIFALVNDEICSSILDVSFQRLLKKEKINPGTSLSDGTLELWSDDFEGKGDFSQYRSRLVYSCGSFQIFGVFCFQMILKLWWQTAGND